MLHLRPMGARLRELRDARGLTRAAVAAAAELHPRTVERIEAGERRTRCSTLERIAVALGDVGLADELAVLAGEALAPESVYADRVNRRRERRRNRRRRRRERAAKRDAKQTLAEVERYVRDKVGDVDGYYPFLG